MPTVFVMLFWIWFAISISVLAFRMVTTGTFKPGGTPRRERKQTEAGAADAAARRAAFEAKLAATTPEHPDPADSSDAAESMETGQTRETSEPKPAPVTVGAASATDAREVLGDEHPWQAVSTNRASTLADALHGIQMPADLAPLIGNMVDPRHMLFATFSTTPAVVGTSLADELERLGYHLTPLDDRSIAAARQDARLEVRILPDRTAAQVALGDKAALVPDDAVIAEFQLR